MLHVIKRFPRATRPQDRSPGVSSCLVSPESFERHHPFFVACRGGTTAKRDSGKMSDRQLTCRDCGQTFTFTAGEQDFYQQRGYTDPQRCPSCRAARKAQRGDSGGYSSGGYGGGGYSAGGGRGYSSGPRQMYPAVCSNCGKETEVPFQPTAGKPVYCRECFQQQRSSSARYDRY
jgi:CxxC-x17-CxxC domain-containing protein